MDGFLEAVQQIRVDNVEGLRAFVWKLLDVDSEFQRTLRPLQK